MAIIKCKMCGGDLAITPDMTVAECEYCGSKQTIPTVDNEKKTALFLRANKLRFDCDFDRAAGIYDSIIADYPAEAEAYWGLILCKFGIEYVDDPATGKKIPTCHRSSFTSVMEDENLERVMEYADAVARRVYREEAKQIEQLRKGIIEVSGKEEPYDIFICYKESDENGDRTLDSVLAHDVYDVLSSKGYRVFFSRITLEDKLGQEYEPYIFAALNSAKIMLAFGTDYEYFNAVWVKNEWSRYLQLMTQDKSKHLIPCYKGIDAYDMPKEFAKLQAQDLGKVGAIQDLLRGIEKLLPRQEKVPVIRQVVTSGSSNVAALLKRGNLALEDEEWQKADEFFDRVLDLDAECAEAYLGKLLTGYRMPTLESLLEKWTNIGHPNPKVLTARERDIQAENVIAEKYEMLPYLDRRVIKEQICFDLTYDSQTERLEAWKQQVLRHFQDRNMIRAAQFGTPELRAKLKQGEYTITAAYDLRIAQTRTQDQANACRIQQEYANYLQKPENILVLYAEAEHARERDYAMGQTLIGEGKFAEAKRAFLRAGETGYRDSLQMAQLCDDKKGEAEAAERAAAEQKEATRKQEKTARSQKRKLLVVVPLLLIVAIVAAYLYVTLELIPSKDYGEAEALLNSGAFVEAEEAFEKLGSFRDSPERVVEAQELQIQAALNVQYMAAEKLLRDGDITGAALAFGVMDDYLDSGDKSRVLWDEIAIRDTISAGGDHTIAVKEDGTVVAVGSNEDNQCNVEAWHDIIAVAAGGEHTLGLRADGTVVATGNNSEGQCNVSEWENVIAISAGWATSFGICRDGTVYATGDNAWDQCSVQSLQNIVAIDGGQISQTICVKSDGSCYALGNTEYRGVGTWDDIVRVQAGAIGELGLKADGTVVYTLDSTFKKMKDKLDIMNQWTDMVSVSAGAYYYMGLQKDGTVKVAEYGNTWESAVSQWKNIAAISAGSYHAVGLREDGSVVAVGENENGQCNVSDWTDIKLPNT